MNKDFLRLTTAQFAKLHNVNRRTLHYYDKIGLFSPNNKGENNYRYYDALQSIDFESILMFKKLNMSIQEIKKYLEKPNQKDFIVIIDKKSSEIEEEIKKLEGIQNLLHDKKEQLLLSEKKENKAIQIIKCEQEELLTIPFAFTVAAFELLEVHTSVLFVAFAGEIFAFNAIFFPAAKPSTSSTNGSISPSSKTSAPIAGHPIANTEEAFNASISAVLTSTTSASLPAASIPLPTASAIACVFPDCVQ